MTKRKTHREFVEQVHSLVGDEYAVTGIYLKAHSHILMRHNACNNEYPVSPANFIMGKRCPHCFGNKRKSLSTFKDEVISLVGSDYSVLGEYINIDTHILMRHNLCGYKYKVTPYKFLNGRRCPKCMDIQRIKTHTKSTKKFCEEVRDKVGEEYTVIGEYIYALSHIEMRHNKCNKIYPVTPANFLNGKRCPNCRKSTGEERIMKFLENKKILFKKNKTFPTLKGLGGGWLSYDFYIKEYNLLIEYQGEQHERPVDFYGQGIDVAIKHFKKQQEHDARKRLYAEENSIGLLEIWYWEYDNIENILNSSIKKMKEQLGKD